ncbi:LysR family transcriptional regulator [uncultured Megasphaera sp.]|uniref:LysR family transcriptional regulator n=1 Tax=uncultured Megasphaera sp. TaxID=165188 RepID=UPI0025CE08FC|nr:LysR family transcriptional regulator [uncultured Megasphaera sp.]
MTLQQLRYILELSKHNSISAAAQALNISQPSLSTAIRDLEKEFSLTLVERNRHGITFTPAGLEFLHYASHILAHTAAMYDHFRGEKKEDLPRALSISSQHYPFADEAFLHALQHVPQEAAFTFTLREGRTSQVIHDVVTRESQLGILFLSHMNERFLRNLFCKNKLEFCPLCAFTPCLYVRSGHPLAASESVVPKQFRGYPCVRFEQGQNEESQFSEELLLPDTSSRQCIYVTDRSTLFSVIRETNAYTIGTGHVAPTVVGRHIRAIPIANPLDKMTVGWIKIAGEALPPEAARYIEILTELLEEVRSL